MEKTELMKRYEQETGKPVAIQEGPCKGCIQHKYYEWLSAKATAYDIVSQEKLVIEFTILHALNGRTDYEGLPASNINWIQVLRLVTEKAKAYDRLMSMNTVSENEIKIVLDGNAWCAYRLPFRNLQEDNAGFGVTPQIALTALLESEMPDNLEVTK
jgi:hypothetical protein